MSQKLRFGILGTGNIARQFCLGCGLATRVEVAAVASRSSERSHCFADEHNIGSAYGSYEELLTDTEIDAVYVSLPNSLHAEWSIKALRAKKHVLCEKPIAIDTQQATEMFTEARRNERHLVEAFMYRSHPLIGEIKKTIADGRIGALRAIRANFCFQVKEPQGNVRFDKDLAGGAVMDVGVYCINFSRYLTGEEPDQIHAVGDFHRGGVDGLVGGCLHFPGGVVSIFLCGLTAQNDNSVVVCGSEGYLDIPFAWKPPMKNAQFRIVRQRPPLTDQKKGQPPATPPEPEIVCIQTDNSLYGQEADDFAATVLDGSSPVMSPGDSIGNMRVGDAIAAALRTTE